MIDERKTVIWPLMLAAVLLMVICATSPRGWEGVARRAPIRAVAISEARLAPPRAQSRVERPAIDADGWQAARPAAPAAGSLVLRESPPPASVAEAPLVREPIAPRVAARAASGPSLGQPSGGSSVAAREKVGAADRMFAVPSPLPSPAFGPDVLAGSAARTPSAAALPPVARVASLPVAELAARSRRPGPELWVPRLAPPLAAPAAQTVDTAATSPAGEPAAPWWPVPDDLLASLEQLSWDCETSDWAVRVLDQVHAVLRSTGPNDPRATAAMADLWQVASQSDAWTHRPLSAAAESQVRRAQLSLLRRLDIWENLAAAVAVDAAPAATAHAPDADLGPHLSQVLALASDTSGGAIDWRSYLLLDALENLSHDSASHEVESRRALAQRVLSRLSRSRATGKDARFLASPAMQELALDLRKWVTEPIDARALLGDLETYERTGLPSAGAIVAEQAERLRFSTVPAHQELARWVDNHYRNANLRIAVSGTLLNRFVAEPVVDSAPVMDMVMGLPTRGWSTTTTRVGLELVPDPSALHVVLRAEGHTKATTRTDRSPVRVFSDGTVEFVARKGFVVTGAGLTAEPTDVAAESVSRLKRIATDFDGVPLLGTLVQSIARQKHDEGRWIAKREVDRKVTREVSQRIDEETAARLANSRARMRELLLDPLAGLDLAPEAVQLETTADRLHLRFRVAGADQSAGHAARPRAPQDSLVSVQAHESLLNNVIGRLGLDGRTFRLPDLLRHVAEHWSGPELGLKAEDLPNDIEVTFAARDAVRVRAIDGRLQIVLAIAELKKIGRPVRTWRNFQANVAYRPDADSRRGELVRDGIITLTGDRLSTAVQIPLRSVLTKMFPPERRIAVVPAKILDDARLADLEVTQLEVRDGWVGVALGPKRSAETASAADVIVPDDMAAQPRRGWVRWRR